MKREQALGHEFANPALLEQALTHRSHAHEHGGADNERLEFLGDAVLQHYISSWLFTRFPNASEGQLSKLRSRLVSTEALAETGARIHVGKFLHLGRGERKSGGRKRPRNLACAVEAVLGAIYLDGGEAAARSAVKRWLGPQVTRLERKGATAEARGALQEHMEARGKPIPTYAIVEQTGPQHAPVFVATVSVEDAILGQGQGATKQTAYRAAAAAALAAIEERTS